MGEVGSEIVMGDYKEVVQEYVPLTENILDASKLLSYIQSVNL